MDHAAAEIRQMPLSGPGTPIGDRFALSAVLASWSDATRNQESRGRNAREPRPVVADVGILRS